MRVYDLDAALAFFVNTLGLIELRRKDFPQWKFTLIFLGTGAEGDNAEIELTYNYDPQEPYSVGRNFGHNEAFMGFTFPEPKGGGIVIVSYPFLFQPS